MTDRKFTDDEVIKALGHCINDATCELCNYSPSSCYINENALYLINRQKAEIEELKIRNERQRHAIKVYQINKTKTEAIKEFADRLKDHITVVTTLANDENVLAVEYEHIENLVKELTEEKK